jgi:hypothetical protein
MTRQSTLKGKAMKQFEIIKGSRVVTGFSNDGSNWSSRLYVNHGETATLTCANHKTLNGAQKWAKKVLER